MLPEQNVRLLAVHVADWLLNPLDGLHFVHHLAMDNAQDCGRVPHMTTTMTTTWSNWSGRIPSMHLLHSENFNVILYRSAPDLSFNILMNNVYMYVWLYFSILFVTLSTVWNKIKLKMNSKVKVNLAGFSILQIYNMQR